MFIVLRAKKRNKSEIQRQNAGLSQKELAEVVGIPLRTIQQYEQWKKSINKAQVQYLIALSKVLKRCPKIRGM